MLGWRGCNLYGCGRASSQDANNEARKNSHAWIVSESHHAKRRTVCFHTKYSIERVYTVVGMNVPQELA